jgi:hypothetical protein
MKFKKAYSRLSVDPLVAGLTPEIISGEIDAFQSLLDLNFPEENIHGFLATHSYFFNSILRMYGVSPLYSKVRLGSTYEVDFAWFDTGSYGPEWRLAEIEAPGFKMFTKSGEPSARLTHALQQIRDWHTWIHQNLDFARKLMPSIEYPMAYLFVGRRSELTDVTRNRLRRIAYENRMSVEIHTLDWFLSAARSTLTLVGPRGGAWPAPMQALTHADLAAGLPPPAKEWIGLPMIQTMLDHFREFRLQERDHEQFNW